MEVPPKSREINIANQIQWNQEALPGASSAQAARGGARRACRKPAWRPNRDQLLSQEGGTRGQKRNTLTSPANFSYLKNNVEAFPNCNAAGWPATARQSVHSHYDAERTLDSGEKSCDQDQPADFMDRLDVRQIRHKLFSRDGGACLTNDGAPFLVNQMNKERLIKGNKAQRLRTERFDKVSQSAAYGVKPRAANYILDRIKTNERLFNKAQQDRRDKVQLQEYLSRKRMGVKRPQVSKYPNSEQSSINRAPQSRDKVLVGDQGMGAAGLELWESLNHNPYSTEINLQDDQQRVIQTAKGFQMARLKHGTNNRVLVDQSTSEQETLANRLDSRQDSQPFEDPALENAINSLNAQKRAAPPDCRLRNVKLKEHNFDLQQNFDYSYVLEQNKKGQKSPRAQVLMKPKRYAERPVKMPAVYGKSSHMYPKTANPKAYVAPGRQPPSDLGEGSVSKCSKITIHEQQLKELGIFNIKFDSTQNIFAPTKINIDPFRTDQKSKLADSPVTRGGSPRLAAEVSLQIQQKLAHGSRVVGPESPATADEYRPLPAKIPRFGANELKNEAKPNNENGKFKAANTAPNACGSGDAKEVGNVDISPVLSKDIGRSRKKQEKAQTITQKLTRFSPQHPGGKGQFDFSPEMNEHAHATSTINAFRETDSNGSLHSSARQQIQTRTKPLWVVNRKPQSIIVNYKSNEGQNLTKVSAGDPQYKNLLNQSNKSQLEDQSHQKKENVVCIYSGQIKLTNEKKLDSNQSRPTSSPEENVKFQFNESKDTERSAKNLSKMQPVQSESQQGIKESKPDDDQQLEKQPRSPRLCEIMRARRKEEARESFDTSDSPVIPRGMKDLKVGLSPRFILQTKGEFNGTKIGKPDDKRNELFQINFENLNLKPHVEHNADLPPTMLLDSPNISNTQDLAAQDALMQAKASTGNSGQPNRGVRQQRVLMNVQQIQDFLAPYGRAPRNQWGASRSPNVLITNQNSKIQVNPNETVLLASIPKQDAGGQDPSDLVIDQLKKAIQANEKNSNIFIAQFRNQVIDKNVEPNFGKPKLQANQQNQGQKVGERNDNQIFIQTAQLGAESELHTATVRSSGQQGESQSLLQAGTPSGHHRDTSPSHATKYDLLPGQGGFPVTARGGTENTTRYSKDIKPMAQIDEIQARKGDKKAGQLQPSTFEEQSKQENCKSNSKIVYQKKKSSPGMANIVNPGQSMHQKDQRKQSVQTKQRVTITGPSKAMERLGVSLNVDTDDKGQARPDVAGGNQQPSQWTPRQIGQVPIVEVNGETSQEVALSNDQGATKLEFQNVRIDSKFSHGSPAKTKMSYLTDKTEVKNATLGGKTMDIPIRDMSGDQASDFKEDKDDNEDFEQSNEIRVENDEAKAVREQNDEKSGQPDKKKGPQKPTQEKETPTQAMPPPFTPQSPRNKKDMSSLIFTEMRNVSVNGFVINAIQPQLRSDQARFFLIHASPAGGQPLRRAEVETFIRQSLIPEGEGSKGSAETTSRLPPPLKKNVVISKKMEKGGKDAKGSPLFNVRNFDNLNDVSMKDSLNNFAQSGISSKSLLNPKEIEQNLEKIQVQASAPSASVQHHRSNRERNSGGADASGLKTLEHDAICKQQSIEVHKGQSPDRGEASASKMKSREDTKQDRPSQNELGGNTDSASFKMDKVSGRAKLDELNGQQDKASVFDSFGQATKTLKDHPPKYLEKQNFGLKFRFQNQSSRRPPQPEANPAAQNKDASDPKHATIDVKSKRMNLNIRELCSQSRKRSIAPHGLRTSVIQGSDIETLTAASPLPKEPQSTLTRDGQAGQEEALRSTLKSNSLNVQFKVKAVPALQPLSLDNEHKDQLFQNLQLQGNQHHVVNVVQPPDPASSPPRQKSQLDKRQGYGGPWGTGTGVPLHLRLSENLRRISNLSDLSIKEAERARGAARYDFNQNYKNTVQQLHTFAMASGRVSSPPIYYIRQDAHAIHAGRKPQTVKYGNAFQRVHKGLVSSSHVPRRIDKLSGIPGQFKNKDDVSVTVNSPRQAIVGSLLTSPLHQPDYILADSARDMSRKCPPPIGNVPGLASSLSPALQASSETQNAVSFRDEQNDSHHFGQRDLFILPTSIIEDLRKEQKQRSKQYEGNFGLIGQQVTPGQAPPLHQEDRDRQSVVQENTPPLTPPAAVQIEVQRPGQARVPIIRDAKTGRSPSPITKATDPEVSNADLDFDGEDMVSSIKAKSKASRHSKRP